MVSVNSLLFSRNEQGKRTSSASKVNLEGRARDYVKSKKWVRKRHIIGKRKTTDGVVIVNWADTRATKRTAKIIEKT